MSFRDNLQHLRATRNMTQEQLAMLLGVSRQSVSKWEAEKAYPEMDKLLSICQLFGCTLDELVSGDLTARPADASQSMPDSMPQDITGYDAAMRRFANRLSAGIAIIIFGLALTALVEGISLFPGANPDAFSIILLFICIGIGLAFIIPASIEHGAFRKTHPFVEDFYSAEEKATARKSFSTGLITGISLLLIAIIALILLTGNDSVSTAYTDVAGSQVATGLSFAGSESLGGFIFYAIAALGVWFIVRASLLYRRTDLKSYNHDSLADMDSDQIDELDDPKMREKAMSMKHENGNYGAIMLIATAVGLMLLFVPVFHAQSWFWLAWPLGGMICGAVAVFRKNR